MYKKEIIYRFVFYLLNVKGHDEFAGPQKGDGRLEGIPDLSGLKEESGRDGQGEKIDVRRPLDPFGEEALLAYLEFAVNLVFGYEHCLVTKI